MSAIGNTQFDSASPDDKIRDEAISIVKLNIETFNKRLLFQDRVLFISLFFIIINYLLVVEPNYSSYNDLQNQKKRLYSIDNNIKTITGKITPVLPVVYKNANLSDSAIVKATLDSATRPQRVYLSKKFDELQYQIKKKDNTNDSIKTLQNEIKEAKDPLSVFKIFLFINNGSINAAVFLSVVITFIITYFYFSRKYLLALLSKTIRIQKEYIGLNKFYEYAVRYSIWLAPIPTEKNHSIDGDDLVGVFAISNIHKQYNKAIWFIFSTLFLIQLRLYHIELNINGFKYNIFTLTTIANCFLLTGIFFLWVSKSTIPDTLNNEKPEPQKISRKQFISFTLLSVVPLGVGMAAYSIFNASSDNGRNKNASSHKPYKRTPRFIANKRKKVNPNSAYLQRCLALIAAKKYDECINLLTKRSAAPKENTNKKSVKKTPGNKNYPVKLNLQKTNAEIYYSDMLVKMLFFEIYRKKDPDRVKTYMQLLTKVIHNAQHSLNPAFVVRAKKWEDPNNKLIKACKDKKSAIKWSTIQLT